MTRLPSVEEDYHPTTMTIPGLVSCISYQFRAY